MSKGEKVIKIYVLGVRGSHGVRGGCSFKKKSRSKGELWYGKNIL